jgi:hypothetical protein
MTIAHAWTGDGTLGSSDGYTGPICARCGLADLPGTPVECKGPALGTGTGYGGPMANQPNPAGLGPAHRNAAIICLWVSGAAIEVQSPTMDTWSDVPTMAQLHDGNRYLEPNPLHPEYDYMNFRVKV